MDSTLAIAYLAALLALLGILGWFIVQQVVKSRNLEKTISDLQPRLQKGKGTAQEHYELGSVFLRKKIYARAIGEFQKALKAEGGETLPEIYNAMGYAYFAQEQYDLAIKTYKESLALQPNYVVALNNLANAYEKKKLTPQAIETYEKTLEFDPNNKVAQQRVESLRKRVAT